MPELGDVVFVSAPPWAGPTRFSKHHLAEYLATSGGARVLYVEAPLGPLSLRRGRAFLSDLAATQQLRRVAERLWVRRHFLPIPYHAVSPLTSLRLANRLGQRLLAPAIRADLQRLGFREPIVIAGLPHAVDLLDLLPHRLVVYHCADDYAHVAGFPRTLPALEAELCRRADLVVTTSETLCRDRRRWNPRTYWIPNGADVAHFAQPAPLADELQRIPRPIIGFVGGLSEWVDTRLLVWLAQRQPQWSIVLIGPASVETAALRAASNVHLLGPRPYAALPRYLAGMDVALIPFLKNPVTFHADPIKAYEYLAAGVPVVATRLPALERLSGVVRLADSDEEFARQIAAALAAGREAGRTARQAEAAQQSWQQRFAAFVGLVEEVAASTAGVKPPPPDPLPRRSGEGELTAFTPRSLRQGAGGWGGVGRSPQRPRQFRCEGTEEFPCGC